MRIFLLSRTLLRDVGRLPNPPEPGDVIAFLRHAQDVEGAAAETLEMRGIETLNGNSLIDAGSSKEIDRLGAAFLYNWCRIKDVDVSSAGKLSLGKLYGLEFARQANPRMLIRLGEIVRRLLEEYPQAQILLTDIEDGEGVFRVLPDYMPYRRIVTLVAGKSNCAVTPLPSLTAVPPSFVRRKRSTIANMIRTYLGGFRLRWLKAGWHLRQATTRGNRKPLIYAFANRGVDLVASRLGGSGHFNVVTTHLLGPGTLSLRPNHLLALPRLMEIQAARRLIAHARSLAVDPDVDEIATYREICYLPVLGEAFAALLEKEIWPFLVTVAQTRKLLKITDFSALLINGAGNEPMGILVALTQDTDRRVYLLSHGMDVHKIAIYCPVVDNPHVIHLAYGTDHGDDYRLYLPALQAPRQHVIGSPVASIMNPVRGKRPATHHKRLLILAFGHLEFWNAERIFACDNYFIDLFRVARELIDDGWTISCRGHPGHPNALERLIAEEIGIGNAICWDQHASLSDALLNHDVVVSNLTSAYYQSLYASWPTIFYEPDRSGGGIAALENDPMFTGLITASDIERPVTNDPDALIGMIRETLDPESPTATFPQRFVSEYADRFIGPHAERADEAIAQFIEADFFGESTMPDKASRADVA